jgi:ribonucleoside-diphosphate reductase alpha chain
MSVPFNLDTGYVKSGDTSVKRVSPGSRERSSGLSIERRFTAGLNGADPLDTPRYETRRSVITNPDGSVVFEMNDAEVPVDWSQLATDIIVSKYFRKTEVPQQNGGFGPERSARQVCRRIAVSIRQAGERLGGYFASPEDAQAFQDELAFMLIHQLGAFNSPAWFNCGLAEAYGIKGKPVGNWAWNPETGQVEEAKDAYSHPQISACFIQSISDDLMDIAAGVQREMRLFKFGSGTGTNFSSIRAEGELLSSGGTSSGLMSFLEVFDKAAGATKSGGTTRRAAKMVILDMDHPDVEKFIEWKAREEDKVLALIKAGYPSDFNGEAYRTVSGQNSNNSVRVTDDFMRACVEDREWQTRWRTTGGVARTHRARDLLKKVSQAAWRCADPGMQFDTTVNRWHTVPNSGRINASNPCSEFMFLDDTSCNLASINLMKFLVPTGGTGPHKGTPRLDIAAFRHASRVFILAQEIIVDYASYPTQAISQNSHDYRPLGLGYANLGSLLMVQGVPYDSPRGAATCAAITALMTGAAYEASADIAASKGPFPGFAHNREPMLRVMNQHRDAAYAVPDSYSAAGGIDGAGPDSDLLAAARDAWDRALAVGERHGYRNAQATVLAPTGTIGLLMDCDTTGIEPDFALVKFKKLAGGGYFKIVNQTVQPALETLGYSTSEVEAILTYLKGTLHLNGTPHVNRAALLGKGLTKEEIDKAEAALPGAFDLKNAFSKYVIGEGAITRLGFTEAAKAPKFDLLEAIGFTKAQLEEAADTICGRMTVEGAPHLKAEHLPVFDCANRCGKKGTRYIHPLGHIRMMAAAQPFISGAISKTVNLPKETTVDDVEKTYLEAWKLGLKAIALYRDGSKASQVLSGGGESKDEKSPPKDEKSKDEKKPVESKPVAAAVAVTAAPAAATPAAEAPRPELKKTELAPTAGALSRLTRRRLPKKRRGFTQEAKVGGQKVYLRTGEYEDGSLGELFVDMHKEGAALRSMMNCFAISVSLGLQHGVPLDEFVNAFTFTRFEPQGPVDHPNIKFATSVIDFIFRLLGMEYLGRTDFVHVKPADSELEEERDLPVGGGSASLAAESSSETSAHGSPDGGRRAPVDRAPQASAALPVLASATNVSPPATNGTAHAATGVAPHAAHKNGSSEPQAQVPAPQAAPQAAPSPAPAATTIKPVTRRNRVKSALSEQASELMGDAPFCGTCGHITVRNGSCYRCLNCGNSMGCS